MTDLELKAEVFRILKNFQELGAKRLMEKLKEYFPKVSKEKMCKIIKELE